MLRNREICPHPRLGHYEMASYLTHNPPARFLKGLNGFLAGNICEPRHLQGDYDFRLASVGGQSGHRFLIFGPQPGNYRLLDIGQSFFLALALRNAPGQGRTFGHNPTVLGLGQCHVKYHFEPHPSAMMPLHFNRQHQKQSSASGLTMLRKEENVVH